MAVSIPPTVPILIRLHAPNQPSHPPSRCCWLGNLLSSAKLSSSFGRTASPWPWRGYPHPLAGLAFLGCLLFARLSSFLGRLLYRPSANLNILSSRPSAILSMLSASLGQLSFHPSANLGRLSSSLSWLTVINNKFIKLNI